MKAEELMVGDLISMGGVIRVVTGIHDKETENGVDLITTMIPGHTFPESNLSFQAYYCYPIPLTPEILEKNGFEKLDFSHYHINNRALVLDADGKWDSPLSWHWVVTEMSTNAKGQRVVLDYYVATIKYVHELQHALRICRIEKEITL